MIGQNAAHCFPDWNHGERAKRIQTNDAPQFLAGDSFLQDGEVDRIEKGNAEADQHTRQWRDDRRCRAWERQAEHQEANAVQRHREVSQQSALLHARGLSDQEYCQD